MSLPPSESRIALPRWLIVAGSVAIVVHLFALGALVLAAPSGPWWVPPPVGVSDALPPTFAAAANEVTEPNYLSHVRLTHNYHFRSNRMTWPGVELEARLKFKDGQVKTLKFPDKDANPWVRHRQLLLIRGLTDDRPVMLDPTRGVAVVRGDAKKRIIQYWEAPQTPPEGNYQSIFLKTEAEDLIPRRPGEVMRPSEWALLLAHSFARYLCREYGAESAELIRYTQEAIHPVVLFGDREPPPDAFPILKANFGEFSK
jgi:hypothetical protein